MAGDVTVGILGPLEVRAAGEAVNVPGPRLRALLIRLAMDPRRIVPLTQLIDAVWEDSPPAGAANALQSLVSRLRRALPDVVETSPYGYRLTLDPEAVDAIRFESLAERGRAEMRTDPGKAAATLRGALGLWRGPALADIPGAYFAIAAAARLEELRLDATENRIEADLAFSGAGALAAELEELVALHPLRERLNGQLMRALAAAGRQADALAAYERLRTRLADDLGIDPSQELRAIHLSILRGEPAQSFSRKAPGSRAAEFETAHAERAVRSEPETAGDRTNLRAQISSFVGREADIARITDVLGNSRLITLVGPGGAGKTRLAAEAAARMPDAAPDGRWMVELAPIADPEEVPQEILSLLGAREIGLLRPRSTRTADSVTPEAVAPAERLIEAIGGKNLLLVMDNCEHLVAGVAAFVYRLLGGCPALRVLATSREPLGITGEVLHPVEPLTIPDDGVTPAESLGYPAVRLFADRAAAVRPGFALNDTNVTDVIKICRALDGIPLAIELAAARMRALTADQIAARLNDRFRLLGAGAAAGAGSGAWAGTRTGAADGTGARATFGAARSGAAGGGNAGNGLVRLRHRSLRAAVDWSWDLLEEPERILLRRLAVFAGGATVEAAEQVCAAAEMEGPPADDVLYLLASLVDKSLVVSGRDEHTGEVRYWLLDTIRAYGDERLREAGEHDVLWRAHLRYFLGLAERAEPHLRAAEQLEWMAELTADRDNLHAALRWAIESGESRHAARLVAELGWYWYMRSSRTEAIEWADRVLAVPGDMAPVDRASTLAVRTLFGVTSGSAYEESLRYGDEALAILRARPFEEKRWLDPALALFEPLISIFRGAEAEGLDLVRALADHPDAWVRSVARLLAANLLINLGETAAARAEIDLALAGFRRLGDRWGLGNSLITVADMSATEGRHEAATAAFSQAQAILGELGDREDIAQLMIRHAMQRAQAGDVQSALEELDAAARISEEIGATEHMSWIGLVRADIARSAGRLDEARAVLDLAISEFATSAPPIYQLGALLLAARGRVEVTAGDLEKAHYWYLKALRAALGTKDRPVIARVIELSADIALAKGDAVRAATLLGTAESLRGGPDRADPEVRRIGATARAALGDAEFDRAYQRGSTRPRNDIQAGLGAEVPDGTA